MKKAFLFPAVLALVSFNISKEQPFAKTTEKSFSKIKPGIFINKFEVSNADYAAFLSDVSASMQGEKYAALLPDTLVWRNILTYNEPFTSFYFRHLSFANYPVVGVSYEAAVAYCSYYTESYNKDSKRKYEQVLFRLPTKEEWTLAASGGDSKKQYPWGSGFTHNSRSMALCNFNENASLVLNEQTNIYEAAPAITGEKRVKITTPVKAFFPNSFGLYNMSGNVAEMVAEKGIAKGGSYTDPAWMVTIGAEKKYAGPTSDIGFRPVMQIIRD